MKVTRTLLAVLACVACASPLSAQPSERARAKGESVRAAQEQARQAAQAQRRGRGTLGRGQALRGGAETTETFSRTVRLEQGGTFDLQNIAGNISIIGGRGNETRIEAVKRVRGVAEQRARAVLESVRIEVAERGGNVEVRTVQPRTPVVAVDYVVTLPARANVILRSGSGNLHLQNVTGEVRAESDHGEVVAESLRRIRLVRSLTGPIRVNDSEADEVNVSTAMGDVIIRNLKGRVLDLRTVFGNVLMQNIATERATLESTEGNLEFAGRLARSGRYQFVTHGGNIRVTPSGNPGFDLEAMTFSGDVRSDFTLKMLEAPAAGSRPRAQQVLRGTFGDAGAVLTASTFSGDIVIIKP